MLIVVFLSGSRSWAKERPNILYVFTDDQSTRTVSCYPESRPWVRTPNIDALAREGVRFESVYMATFCVPSRISQLTGNLPHSARGNFGGIALQGDDLNREIRHHPFWVQRLRESGYHTAMIGKWHIYSRMPAVGIDWDYAVYWHKRMVNAYYYDQKVSINGNDPIELNGYSVDRYTDFAINYIEERAESDQPWYLWLCYSSPHSPQTPAKRHQGFFSGVSGIELPRSFAVPREGKPNYVRKLPSPKTSTVQELILRYNECILSIDESVGRLEKALQETGQLEDTVFIFASDQGLGMGHHGHVKKKNAPYDDTLASPLIFRFPRRFPAGEVCGIPVGGTDIVQTLHALGGIQALPSMDGESLLPVLEDPDAELKRDVLLLTNTRTHFAEDIPRGVVRRNREASTNDQMPMWVMIRSGHYKYATYTGDEAFEEIYNLAEDPEELRNLALLPEYEPLLNELRMKAAKELSGTQSGFDNGHFIDFLPCLKDVSR
ncbi:sulfatase-like hydrolase/transferase [Bremerella sp. P1]|nr:sulfatase-like hydrolase/transferase [Bremerella sp. P1]WDI45242.1 sulfatase-like hydrolase/transferase [Bremerella sp. P1]